MAHVVSLSPAVVVAGRIIVVRSVLLTASLLPPHLRHDRTEKQVPTTIRDYRLVTGMTRAEAVLEIARVWLDWDGDTPRPASLVVHIQVSGDTVMQTYSYECPAFQTALAITESVYDAKDQSTLVRVEWHAPHYGWCDKCGDPLDAEGRCDYLRRHGEAR